MNKCSSVWHLITIVDPNGLPGNSIFNIIQIILKCYKFNYIILDDIEGAAISFLKKNENRVISLSEFLIKVIDVIQFDWGDFFLFKEYPTNWDNSKDKSYPYIIAKTDTTIRAIDDTYIYVYTPYQEIVDVLKINYNIEFIKTDFLSNLDYPY